MTESTENGGVYSEVFEEGSLDTRQSQSVHRIRANSSIMQMKKILGMYLQMRNWPIGPILSTGLSMLTVGLRLVANRGEIRKLWHDLIHE